MTILLGFVEMHYTGRVSKGDFGALEMPTFETRPV